MLKLSVSELSTYRWGFEEDVLHYRQAGFSALGIWRPKLAEYGDEDSACRLVKWLHRELGLRDEDMT